jgi:precorrin-3B C17-methyltransferase
MRSGKIYVVGMGPGNEEHMSIRCRKVLSEVEYIVGYKKYIQLIKHLPNISGECIEGVMKKEVDRCREALDLAEKGHSVALVSSGDSGIYGMAGLVLELIEHEGRSVDCEIIPGITAAHAAASRLGAPIMHDSAYISLSNLLTEWELIEKRIKCASEGDFVITLYNPKSKGRPDLIDKARDIMLKFKSAQTPVGIVKKAMRDGETIVITTLEDMLKESIDMMTVIIVGNSRTKIFGQSMVTPRGYEI